MKIAVDAMGGDHAPKEIVAGAVRAARDFPVEILLVGPKPVIEKELQMLNWQGDNIHIVEADEVITNDEAPAMAIRRKKNSTIVVGANLVREKQADAFVSAGSTGAVMAAGIFKIGRIAGIERPALAPVMPSTTGRGTVILDIGANMDATPENLYQYAVMGSVYAEKVLNIEKPRVGLINVGVEEGKGNDLVKKAYPLLKEAPICFVGNVEAREIIFGPADVLVCDGFVGNVIIKFMEGMAAGLFTMMKEALMKDLRSKIGAAMVKPALREFKKSLDYTEIGGAPLLGIDGVLLKSHGSSNATAIYSTIRQAQGFVNNRVVEVIKESLHLTGA